MKLSIIIPVYNVAKYIKPCLDSVMNQTLNSFEALLIDDGSDDGSQDIIDEYAEKDKRFVVIHKKHEGVSIARNIGLSKSKGKYIGFLDADDVLHPQRYEKAVKVLDEHPEISIVHCNWADCDESINEIKVRTDRYDKEGVIELPNLPKNFYSVVMKVTRKELFRTVRFYNFGYQGEDTAVSFKLYTKAKKVYCLEDVLYYRVVHNDSLQHSMDCKGKKNLFDVYKKLYIDLVSQGADKEILARVRKLVNNADKGVKKCRG